MKRWKKKFAEVEFKGCKVIGTAQIRRFVQAVLRL